MNQKPGILILEDYKRTLEGLKFLLPLRDVEIMTLRNPNLVPGIIHRYQPYSCSSSCGKFQTELHP